VNSRYFNDSVIVYRSSSTRGSGGEIIKTYSTYLDVVGSFQNGSGQMGIINNQFAFRKTKRFFCNIVDILDTDRIIYSGKTYEIVNVANVAGHHLEIDLQARSTS
jgi:hypothetical protein